MVFLENFPSKMIRFVLLFTAFFLAFLGLSAQKPSKRPDYKLLWKISGKDLTAPSYLFGTMHLYDNRVFDFSDSVLLKISECQAFALEVHPDSLMNAVFRLMLENSASSENKFKKLFSKKDYEELDSIVRLRTGYTLDKIKSPAMAQLMIEKKTGKQDKQTFLDAYLYNLARRQGKIITGLEDAHAHLAVLEMDAPESLREQLIYSLEEEDESDIAMPMTDHLIDMYYKGDVDAIFNFVKGSTISPEYYEKLITDRNMIMVNSIMKEIHDHSTFIAVGAGHLAGDEGVIQLLQKQGYTVKPVTASFTGMAARYTFEEHKEEWYEYVSETGAYAVDMPGKPSSYKLAQSYGITFQTYFDIGTPIMYQTAFIPMANIYNGQSPQYVLNQIESNIVAQGYKKVGKSKSVTIEGLEAREFGVLYDQNFFRIRIILRGDVVYLLQVGPQEQTAYLPEADKFLSSFKIKPFNAIRLKEFSDKKGAFTVHLSGDVSNSVVNPVAEGGARYELNIFYTSNLSAQETYLVRYNDFPVGYVSHNDSTYLTETVNSIYADMKGQDLQTKDVPIDGFKGKEFFFGLSQGAYIRGRAVLRGNRFYLLIATYENASSSTVNEFIESFRFTAYEPTTLKEFTLPEGITLKLPEDADTTTTDTDKRYKAIDPNSGILYILSCSERGLYDGYADRRSFFKEHWDDQKIETDSLLSNHTIDCAGCIAEEVVISSGRINAKKRVRTIVSGRKQYDLIAYLPDDYKTTPVTEEIFSSLKVTPAEGNWDLFSDKTDLLLNDAISTDSLVRMQALNAIYVHKFKTTDLPKLYKVLLQPGTQTDKASSLTYGRLLQKLRETHDSTTLVFIKKLYPLLPDSTLSKDNALGVLASLETKQGFQEMLALMKQDQKHKFSSYSILYACDSLALLGNVLPDLMQMESRFNYVDELFDRATTVLTSDVLTADTRSRLISESVATGKRLALQPLASSGMERYEQVRDWNAMASLLAEVPYTDEVRDILLALHRSGELDIMLTTAVTLLRNQNSVPRKDLEKIAADPQYRVALYDQLKNANKEQLFPTKYLMQEKFAEGALWQYVYDYDDEMPAQIVSLGSREVMYQGEKQKVYVFKYRLYEEGEWYLGLSGPYSMRKGEVVSQGELLATSNAPLSSKTMKESVRQFILDQGAELVK